MRVLVVGSGGREHAICWKIKQSTLLTRLYSAPGNVGISEIADCVDIKPDECERLLEFAISEKIDLTVIGPEQSLVKGVVDKFRGYGLKIFGPTMFASQLESSKIFAKGFMTRYGIPTADYRVFRSSERKEIEKYINNSDYPIVIKADGLAAGKGVVIADDVSTAEATLVNFMDKKIFGESGEKIVIEKYLKGQEASVFAISDGEYYIILPPSQDHKKIREGETGKNTGGMGSYAPANKIVCQDVMEKVRSRIIEPVIRNIKNEGTEFTGCLYAGLMINEKKDPYVIEFNTRFGDPETQSVLPLIKSDFLELLLLASEGKLREYKHEFSDLHACTVVLASEGYPDNYITGFEIEGLNNITQGCVVFHAGTKLKNGKVVSSGGRVLNVTGISEKNLSEAIDIAYRNCELINFRNKYYRKDIGKKGL